MRHAFSKMGRKALAGALSCVLALGLVPCAYGAQADEEPLDSPAASLGEPDGGALPGEPQEEGGAVALPGAEAGDGAGVEGSKVGEADGEHPENGSAPGDVEGDGAGAPASDEAGTAQEDSSAGREPASGELEEADPAEDSALSEMAGSEGESGSESSGETPGAHAVLVSGRTYTIAAAADPSALLTVEGSSLVSGANVSLAPDRGELSQQWVLTQDADGYWTIAAAHSGRVLDVANGVAAPGTNVWQCTPFGNSAQKWRIVSDGVSAFTITSALDEDLALDIADGATAEGTNVQVYRGNGAPAQRFVITEVPARASERTMEDGVYEIVFAGGAGGHALDVADGSMQSGANVRLWERNGAAAQKWQVRWDEGAGAYEICSLASGLALDVADGGFATGTNVWQCTRFGNAAQRWIIELNDDGTCSLYSQHNALALDVALGADENGANVRTWTPGSQASQRFSFVAAEALSEGIYTIGPAEGAGVCIDVPNGTREEGVVLGLWNDNGNVAQKWQATRDSDGLYTFESLASGLVLEAAGSAVTQGKADGSLGQKWRVVPVEGGALALESAASGLRLAYSSAQAGASVQTASEDSRWAQGLRFALTDPITPGYYQIAPADDLSLNIDVADASRESGANVQLWHSNDGNAQVVKLVREADGYYTIQFPFSRKVLDAADGGTTPGTNVWQCTPFGNDAQKWAILYAGDGAFRIESKLSGLPLEAAPGASAGANVQLGSSASGGAQSWAFEPTEPTNFIDLMATFTTYSSNTPAGTYNMQRALNYFDGIVIQPGEMLSFFNVAGPCGAAQGFLPAGIVGGIGYGGGICQASTTLYGAFLRAGLTIVDRQNHSEPSVYVPIGQDAMVNWGTSDLVVRNDWDFPVMIDVTTYDNVLTCDIYGIQPDWYDYIEVYSWWTGSNSAAAERVYVKDGVAVLVQALPSSWYW